MSVSFLFMLSSENADKEAYIRTSGNSSQQVV